MRPESELSTALEALRNRAVVTQSREYAREWQRRAARRAVLRRFGGGTLATAAAAGLLASVGMWLLPQLTSSFSGQVIRTAVGETRSVLLEDGSRLVLDTSSRLRVRFSSGARDIELLDGRAHFEVAKDPRRPFRVRTRSAEVVAVGTMFDVDALPGRTTVTLIEGRVHVYTVPTRPQQPTRDEVMSAGEQLGIASDGELLRKQQVKLNSVTAWQRGMIVLDDMPVKEALAAMNRYSERRIVIDDTTLQARHISGAFRIGDVETEAVALERYFGLRERMRSERAIVLEPR
jgi:transmembrane sensor